MTQLRREKSNTCYNKAGEAVGKISARKFERFEANLKRLWALESCQLIIKLLRLGRDIRVIPTCQPVDIIDISESARLSSASRPPDIMDCPIRISTRGAADSHYAYASCIKYHDHIPYDSRLGIRLMTRKDVDLELSTGCCFGTFVRYFESWSAQVEISHTPTWNVFSASREIWSWLWA